MHHKTKKMSCGACEESDQCRFQLSQMKVYAMYSDCVEKGTRYPLHVVSKDPDQTGLMPSLICLFAGHMSFGYFCNSLARIEFCLYDLFSISGFR